MRVKKIIGSMLMLANMFCLKRTLAQDSLHYFSKELSITTDNDLYAAKLTDRYYTNGINFKYTRVRSNSKAAVLKSLEHYEIGQLIFNAQRREIQPQQTQDIDRPIAGYLFVKFINTKFYTGGSALNYGVSVGTTGSLSLAKNVQSFIHRQFGINSTHWGWIWDYQIKTEPGINLHGTYSFALVKGNKEKFIQLTPVTNATLGTSFTNLTQALALQIGRFNKMHESSFWNASIGSKSHNEFFFFYKPELMYQLYNATIQGGMFRRDKGPILSHIEPFIITHELGLMFSYARYTASAHIFYQSKEATTQVNNHAYGRLQIAYRFR